MISTIMIHDVLSVKVTDLQHGEQTNWRDIEIRQKTGDVITTTRITVFPEDPRDDVPVAQPLTVVE